MKSGISKSKRRLLERIKVGGPTCATALAAELDLTDVAVRQHLIALEGRGLVRQQGQPPRGRGRPSVLWSLTESSEGLFPNRHAELTVGLIDAARAAFGEAGLQRLVQIRGDAQVEAYRGAVAPAGRSLKKRVETLARQRTAEGYMAEVIQERPGCYLLIEHHCPICEAARACTGLCSSELEVFQRCLGDGVKVERVSHLLSGSERCAYRIRRN